VGENIDTVQKNTKAVLDASKEVGPEVNPGKSKYMLQSCCQKAGQRHSIQIANRSFESVAKFKYLGTTLTDQNCMQEEIKSRINSRNACYHSVQSLLSCFPLSRTVKVNIYKILPVVYMSMKLGLLH
jgi:glycerol-3-phosphate O-acyltransferase